MWENPSVVVYEGSNLFTMLKMAYVIYKIKA